MVQVLIIRFVHCIWDITVTPDDAIVVRTRVEDGQRYGVPYILTNDRDTALDLIRDNLERAGQGVHPGTVHYQTFQ